jgi:hypothetical protein
VHGIAPSRGRLLSVGSTPAPDRICLWPPIRRHRAVPLFPAAAFELVAAAVGAEVVAGAIDGELGGSDGWVELHAADRVADEPAFVLEAAVFEPEHAID